MIETIPVYILTCDKHFARAAKLAGQLWGRGFRNQRTIVGDTTDPYWYGLNDAYVRVFESFKPPFITLEDDCRFLPDAWTQETDYSTPCDWMYLGGCLAGYDGPLRYEEVNSSFVRPLNMLSAHAILWHTLPVAHLKPVARKTIVDVVLAQSQLYHNTLLLRKPLFYQADGHNDEASKYEIAYCKESD